MIPQWTALSFAVAGAACAMAPIALHLWNRQKHRVVHWAAMDFLIEAISRKQRFLRLRDWFLLALRVGAVSIFGLALARPYWSTGTTTFEPNGTVHAILVIDNSMSMAYESLGITSLDRAKGRAREFIESLPGGSRVSVIPLCGERTTAVALRRTKALQALDTVDVIDRTGSFGQAMALAIQAHQSTPLPTRGVFFSDQQLQIWHGYSRHKPDQVSVPMQCVNVGPLSHRNVEIADLDFTGSVADADQMTVVSATLRYYDLTESTTVPIALTIDRQRISEQQVTLGPGDGSLRVHFRCQFLRSKEDLGASVVSVSIANDALVSDDQGNRSIPVATQLPILFVDQTGPSKEDTSKYRFGETHTLRRLLFSDAAHNRKQFLHLTIQQLDETVISDRRLIVIAGVDMPGNSVSLLRRFVEEGGQLLIAAGADFRPEAWHQQAWLDGNGILAAPLSPEMIGNRPSQASGNITFFHLSTESMLSHSFFRITGTTEEQLRELYAEPFFFQAVRAEIPKTGFSDDRLPRVLSRFDNGHPFLVERRIGAGRTVLVTSGLTSDWNTLATTSAVVMFDRVLRGLLRFTIPERNIVIDDVINIDVPDDAFMISDLVVRPDNNDVTSEGIRVNVEAARASMTGLKRAGVYHLVSKSQSNYDQSLTTFVVQRPSAHDANISESNVRPITREQFETWTEGLPLHWVDQGKPIRVEGSQVQGFHVWRLLVLLVGGMLLTEMCVLIWPTLSAAWNPAVRAGTSTT